MKKYGDSKSGVDVIKGAKQVASCMLGQDLNHRDPISNLTDVETGKFLQALDDLPHSIRQMFDDSNMRVEVTEIEGVPRITKIIKKREPEFVQGKDQFYVLDEVGRRVPISEEQYDRMLNLSQDPEDVLSGNFDVQTLTHEHTAPMDTWDICYDASAFVAFYTSVKKSLMNDNISSALWAVENEIDNLINAQKLTVTEANVLVNKFITNTSEFFHEMSEYLIYSANYFMYSADKRVHHYRAKEIMKQIQEKNLTKRQLGALIGPGIKEDQRLIVAKQLQEQAKALKPSPVKGRLMLKAQALRNNYYQAKKRGEITFSSAIPQSDKNKLWQAWNEKQLKENGSLQLMSWQFARYLRIVGAKRVADQAENREQYETMMREMEENIQTKVKELYGTGVRKVYHKANLEESVPEWLIRAEAVAKDMVVEDIPEENDSVVDWIPPPEAYDTYEDIDEEQFSFDLEGSYNEY